MNNWDLAFCEIDGTFPTHDRVPIADMIKTIIRPAIEELEKTVGAKSPAKFTVAFDLLTSACNTCRAGANKPFIRIQRPTESPLPNQSFAPGN
jgi:hypothetical protein